MLELIDDDAHSSLSGRAGSAESQLKNALPCLVRDGNLILGCLSRPFFFQACLFIEVVELVKRDEGRMSTGLSSRCEQSAELNVVGLYR